VRRNTQTKELGPKRKTNASSTTSNSMAKDVGDPFPKLLVNFSNQIQYQFFSVLYTNPISPFSFLLSPNRLAQMWQELQTQMDKLPQT